MLIQISISITKLYSDTLLRCDFNEAQKKTIFHGSISNQVRLNCFFQRRKTLNHQTNRQCNRFGNCVIHHYHQRILWECGFPLCLTFFTRNLLQKYSFILRCKYILERLLSKECDRFGWESFSVIENFPTSSINKLILYNNLHRKL